MTVETQGKILIIDDEEVVLDSCMMVLEGHGYHLTVAHDGTDGLKLVQQLCPDLIFVDLKMPGISGIEVLEKVRAIDPTIVVIVITGYASVTSAVEAMKKGAFDFLPKPFTPDELRLIAKRGLEKRRLVVEAITLRRQKEMLRENFAAIISHELRSPLGAIQQNLFVMADELADKLNDDQKHRFERMKSRIGDLLEMIQTWLRAFSMDLAKLRDQFVPVSVSEAISKAVESVQIHATRKAIEIESSLAEPLPQVLGDEASLAEALVNLIGNAVKYSNASSKVSVSAGAKNGRVLISVADTGVGIAPEDVPFVFDDFYRGKAGQPSEKGCGLGLALSKRIIDIHGGTISVESLSGKGTKFVIDLPALQPGGPK